MGVLYAVYIALWAGWVALIGLFVGRAAGL
jgi:hypothetical protein